MSGALVQTGLSTIANLLFRSPRKIGDIIPDCIIEEQHEDQVAITQHPVEKGAAISDHAYKIPPVVHMRVGWSNATSSLDAVGGAISSVLSIGAGGGGEGYARQVYNKLLGLQGTLKPFTLVTGKRTYENMMMEGLSIITTRESEYALACSASFRQIIIVPTVATTLSSQDVQQMPSQTAPVVQTGPAQPVENQTFALSGFNYLTGLFGGTPSAGH